MYDQIIPIILTSKKILFLNFFFFEFEITFHFRCIFLKLYCLYNYIDRRVDNYTNDISIVAINIFDFPFNDCLCSWRIVNLPFVF